MDEPTTTFATKEKFAAKSGGQRRWLEFDCPGVGCVWLRSPTAGEFARVDAARTRAAFAGGAGKKEKEQVRALNDGLVELLTVMVCDGERNPMFGADDRALIVGLDAAVSQALVTACIEHAALDEADLGAAQKN